MRFSVYQALYIKLGTTQFCTLSDGSYMFLTSKDKIGINAAAIHAVGALQHCFLLKFFVAERRKNGE